MTFVTCEYAYVAVINSSILTSVQQTDVCWHSPLSVPMRHESMCVYRCAKHTHHYPLVQRVGLGELTCDGLASQTL